MPNPSTYQFNLPQRGRPSDVMLNLSLIHI